MAALSTSSCSTSAAARASLRIRVRPQLAASVCPIASGESVLFGFGRSSGAMTTNEPTPTAEVAAVAASACASRIITPQIPPVVFT
jgi:hypothetical protein